MANPLNISVVTPSWNQEPFIADAVESVRNQGYPNVEHLVLDNCSTDGSVEILKRYSHLKLLCEPDTGQSDALNKGFKMASGDVIGWLNADDRYLPGCFKAVTDYFNSHPECDIVYGDYRLIDKEGKVLSRRKELSFDLFMLKYLHVLYIPSTTVFFRRRVFEEGNFLDVDYHYAMDYEFFLRLALKGYRFGHINAFLADFRTYPESKSRRQTLTQKQEMEKALLDQDDVLKRLNAPWRQGVRNTLMVAARGKRCSLKFLRGAYFQ